MCRSRPEASIRCLPQLFPPIFGAGPLAQSQSTTELDWLVSKPEGSFCLCLCLSSSGSQVSTTTPGFSGVSKISTLMFAPNHFTICTTTISLNCNRAVQVPKPLLVPCVLQPYQKPSLQRPHKHQSTKYGFSPHSPIHLGVSGF